MPSGPLYSQKHGPKRGNREIGMVSPEPPELNSWSRRLQLVRAGIRLLIEEKNRVQPLARPLTIKRGLQRWLGKGSACRVLQSGSDCTSCMLRLAQSAGRYATRASQSTAIWSEEEVLGVPLPGLDHHHV